MKTIPESMQADLDSGVTTHCFCWRIDRRDGISLGFTEHDVDLSFDGLLFEAATGFEAAAFEQNVGFSIDNSESIGVLSSDRITEDDIGKGLYDNATVTVYRVDWVDVSKRIVIFKGTIGEVTRGSLVFKGEVRSSMHLLNQPQGRKYMRTCDADLFDNRCKVLKASNPNFELTGTVTSVLSQRLITTTSAGIVNTETGWFSAGLLTWNTGNNAGQRIEVKNHIKQGSTAFLDLWELAVNTIQTGDTFTIQVGCDKSIETCKAKFDNVINFRGFPRMPTNDAITQIASRKDIHTGGSWFT